LFAWKGRGIPFQTGEYLGCLPGQGEYSPKKRRVKRTAKRIGRKDDENTGGGEPIPTPRDMSAGSETYAVRGLRKNQGRCTEEDWWRNEPHEKGKPHDAPEEKECRESN